MLTVKNYDVWGNFKDGFEVNNVYSFGEYSDYPDFTEDISIIRFAKSIGLCNKYLKNHRFEIDGDDQTMYIDYAGYPIGELRIE